MSVLQELRHVLQGKRNPHWFYLALPALGVAVGLHVYLRDVDVSNLVVPTALLTTVALPVVVFLILFALLLAHFNTRAVNTDYPIVIQNGEFKYEQELHIALRVETLKNLIKKLTDNAASADASKRELFESGEFAGADFGRKFPELYLKDMKDRASGASWDKLRVQEKLNLWREWDKGVGWGIFQAVDEGASGLRVQNDHVTLYDGPAGHLVAALMAGYVVGVVQEIKGEKVKVVSGPTIGPDRTSMAVVIGR
jgi:hypothetical protein